MSRQPDGDHRLQVATQRRGLDIGMEAADHATLAQAAHTRQARRRRDADAFGERVVGDPGIGRELVQDRAVHSVERPPNVVRYKRLIGALFRTCECHEPRLPNLHRFCCR
jgi:hypothetical protein